MPLLVGCSSQSLIAGGEEIEDAPGIALQLLHRPGADLKALRFADEDVAGAATPSDWHSLTGIGPGKCNGWLVFADPFDLDGEAWLRGWHVESDPSYPKIKVQIDPKPNI